MATSGRSARSGSETDSGTDLLGLGPALAVNLMISGTTQPPEALVSSVSGRDSVLATPALMLGPVTIAVAIRHLRAAGCKNPLLGSGSGVAVLLAFWGSWAGVRMAMFVKGRLVMFSHRASCDTKTHLKDGMS